MNKIVLLIALVCTTATSQVKPTPGSATWAVKEFNKDKALYDSKQFLFSEIFKVNNEILKFEVIPLAAANSGELTTLIYRCEDRKVEGLLLCFYGEYWNDNGVNYTGFQFKNFFKEQATEFLTKIQDAIDAHEKYLKEDTDNNNIVFRFDDVDVMIFRANTITQLRLFWRNFDSTWEKTAFERSRKRFEKRVTK